MRQELKRRDFFRRSVKNLTRLKTISQFFDEQQAEFAIMPIHPNNSFVGVLI